MNRLISIHIRKEGELKNSHISATRGLSSSDLTAVFNHPFVDSGFRDEELKEEFIKEMENRDIKVRFE